MEIIQLLLLVAILILLSKQFILPPTFKTNKKAVVLDTSALIDGRIVEVAKAGFLPGTLLVPQFVVQELQLLADGNDSHKRERARFGLDVIASLQTELGDQIQVINTNYKNIKATDDKLVELAHSRGAFLCTTDYNLNKVAFVRGVRVLNMNELAQAVRPAALPGEKHTIKIVQKGSNKDQGVGYLEDGTMVVVSNAGNMVGKKVDVSVTRMLQTEAGKMIFGTKLNSNRNSHKN